MELAYRRVATRRLIERLLIGFVIAGPVGGCERSREGDPPRVVLYTSLDRSFSEPIVRDFERATGIQVDAVYDTESTKTVGLVNRIRAEAARPRCDVFWNNEVINTVLLQREGLLRPVKPAHGAEYPAEFRAGDGSWHGFAARARVLIVNATLVPESDTPRSTFDLADPKWKGMIGIAKPVAGTTATHVACLFAVLGRDRAEAYFHDLLANDVRIESGNKACAEAVGAGRLAVAWTDTDDAIIEVEAGSPVRIVYPDAESDGIGTLFLPNTLSAVRGSPNPAAADRLIDYLLDPAIEARLSNGPSAQIPVSRSATPSRRVKGPGEVKPMPVDFAAAAAAWESAQGFIRDEFIR